MRFIPRFVSSLISPFTSIMAAFIGSFISLFIKRSSGSRSITTGNVPLPTTCHQILDGPFVSKFEEIFVIGDVHGCFDELMIMLKRISNHDKILKLFVGDLVNKGPKNSEVINFMMSHTDECLSVRGNHDEVVISEWIANSKNPGSLKPKNKWIESITKEQIDYLISLPYTISLPSINNCIIVHAGLIPNVTLDQMDRLALTTLRNLVETKPDQYEWKAKGEGVAWVEKWKGPQFVYFGHDAKRRLQKGQFAIGLDTGCVYGNQLTGVFISGQRSGQFVSVDAKQQYQSTEKKE